ncbi:YhgE/Pip domain-containing protein [Nakamurella lactea]|uniref:YhgE/Pip domain-containing protein n=1 Tax=Nakamurella lactea TaxID=459515 RepID=UPI00041858AB|nr:YhgE/Pip domain-containing protein [Nakamurella lactea]
MLSTIRLAGSELRRFKSGLGKIALIFVMLIPLLYGALYLWSNWDPYGRLDQVPVAVVNLDQPVEYEGETVNAGAQLVDELKNDPIFQWHFTDADGAAAGLADGTYYLTLTVPKDFSANLTSGTGTDPKRAVLMLHRDDVNGYVIGMLTASVQDKIEAAVDQAAIGTYFNAVFGNLEQIRTQIGEAADGASQLAAGAADAQQGAKSLADGVHQAEDGSAKLVTGAGDLKKGSSTLLTGLTQAKSGSATLAAGAADAKSGSAELASGSSTAASGARQLADGIDQLHAGAGTLADGADQVADGNRELADTVVPILDAVVPILPQITGTAADLTSSVADLTSIASGDSDSIASRTAAANATLAQLVKSHPELADDPAVTQLTADLAKVDARAGDIATGVQKVNTSAQKIATVAGTINEKVPQISGKVSTASDDLTTLADGAQQVATGAHELDTNLGTAATSAHTLADGNAKLAAGAKELDTGLGTLSTGAKDLDTGIGKLVEGGKKLDTGVGTLGTGAKDLDSGLTKLGTGADKLVTGNQKLTDGAKKLSTELTKGAERIPQLTQNQQDAAAQVLSSPADAQMTIDHPAEKYGRGLAPFFFAIAIWVFGISAFLVLRPVSERALAGRARASRIAIAGWLPVLALCVLGSLILLFVAWWTLGLNPVNVWGSIGVVALAAACFTAIAHLLRTALGVVGSAVTLVLLMVQLTSAGGLYPVETLPLPLRALNPFMPMTYLIDALRITFTGGPAGHLWRDVAVLAGITVVVVGAGIWVVSRRKRFALKDLYPVLA